MGLLSYFFDNNYDYNKYYYTDVNQENNYTLNENKQNFSVNMIKIGNDEVVNIEMLSNKEQLVEILPSLNNSIDIGKNYFISGEDFNIVIKPTNTSIEYFTHVDFSTCEEILRWHYNISNSRILTFLQLELEDKNSQSLVNQVGYQVYDDKKNILNLSLCNDTNIQVYYSIKSNSSLNISFISSFKDNNIDIFNIKDEFFNDICTSYSDSENDVVLKDRINDIYQNYSLCDEGCTYNEINLELMMITCDCKVKQNLTSNLNNINLVQLNDIKKSTAFKIIKCYQLVFSWENKSENIGFWLFSIFILLHIPFLILFFLKGIKYMKKYLEIIMKKMVT
jgi:hypothetical protein